MIGKRETHESEANRLWDDTAPSVSPEATAKIKQAVRGDSEMRRGEEYAPYASYVKAVLDTGDAPRPVHMVYDSFNLMLRNDPVVQKSYSRLGLSIAAIHGAVKGTMGTVMSPSDREEMDERVNAFTDLVVCDILNSYKKDGATALSNGLQMLLSYNLKRTVKANVVNLHAYLGQIGEKAGELLAEPDKILNNMGEFLGALNNFGKPDTMTLMDFLKGAAAPRP